MQTNQDITQPTSDGTLSMALAFDAIYTPVYEVTRISWTQRAKALIDILKNCLRENTSLPIRDLRLRLQIRDKKVVRISEDLGLYKGLTLLFTESIEEKAISAANDTIAEWVLNTISPQNSIDKDAAGQLRKMALQKQALIAQREEISVFGWDKNIHTHTAKPPVKAEFLFADLAHYVASKIREQEIFPEAGPMRLIVSSTLSDNQARLITDPIEVIRSSGSSNFFSLGLIVRVATYPGRSLPVIIIEPYKSVWTKEIKANYQKNSGYALPEGESRAIKFEIQKDLSLDKQFDAIAREYDLPLQIDGQNTTAQDLAFQGITSSVFDGCKIAITHRYGQGDKETLGRGVTDLDRRLSFEQLYSILKPFGFYAWPALEEINTEYKPLQDADTGWKYSSNKKQSAILNPETKKESSKKKAEKKKKAKQKERYELWAKKMHEALKSHYGGVHHFVLAYQNGLRKDALKAKKILEKMLGKEAFLIHLEALPDNVHGPKQGLSDVKTKPIDRAAERREAWVPFIKTLQEYMDNKNTLVQGVMVLANKWYENFTLKDDSVNKRAARTTLNSELGLIIQYLLPTGQQKEGGSSSKQKESFQMRVINAWRDMTWKSIGKMHSIDLKFKRSLGNSSQLVAPVILSIGIIRSNRKRILSNRTSFIPYAIELNPSTGTCQASMLLQSGNKEPLATTMLDLTKAARLLSSNGPSYLAPTGNDKTTKEYDYRRTHTQKFLHNIITERAKLYEDIIILADSSTLSNTWSWLTDKDVNPACINLNGENHVEEDFPNATFIRIRYHHAPKVVRNMPKVNVSIDGSIRSAVRRCEAQLFRIIENDVFIPTYYSFGTNISKLTGGSSSYRNTVKVDLKSGEEKAQKLWTKDWHTPNAIEITPLQHPKRPRFHDDDLAKLVVALRSEYGHVGVWTTAPAPLHFNSFLKEYIPDYELGEEEIDDNEVEEED